MEDNLTLSEQKIKEIEAEEQLRFEIRQKQEALKNTENKKNISSNLRKNKNALIIIAILFFVSIACYIMGELPTMILREKAARAQIERMGWK